VIPHNGADSIGPLLAERTERRCRPNREEHSHYTVSDIGPEPVRIARGLIGHGQNDEVLNRRLIETKLIDEKPETGVDLPSEAAVLLRFVQVGLLA
jgi:hypothetical protein